MLQRLRSRPRFSALITAVFALLLLVASLAGVQVRVLAVATPQRLSILPDVPTMAEAGVPGFEAYAWQGFVGPARMPAAVVERLNKDLAAALRHTETRAKLEEIGIQPLSMTPQQFTDFVRSEQKLWAGVIRAANIRLD